MIVFKSIIIGLTYIGLGLGYLPGLRMNRASIALVGAALLMAFGVLDLKEAWQAIDYKTLIFLFGMMVISTNLAYAGFFQLTLDTVTHFTRSPLGLLIVLTFGSGILSAFFLNDTIALILTPLVLGLTQTLNLNPIPYLLALAGATNLGSVATLSGNPQNILIGSFSGISYLDFAKALTPIALVSLLIQIALLWWLYPDVRSTKSCPSVTPVRYRIFKPLLTKSLLITGGLLFTFLIGIPPAQATLVAASLLFITRRIKPQRVLNKVDWDLLVMFSGLFVVTAGVEKLGILNLFSGLVYTPLSILGITALLSNLVSNVPAVLLLQHLLPHPDTKTWLLLAAGSTLAGNLTLLGSVANLIVAEAVAKLGYQLSFWEHLRFGLPLTVLTLILTYFWI
ncbi:MULTISPECIES: anion transporter [unclassified Nostoc]|uniref:anion transporter n=1 Tax=unclassified Nostoc TaxID=2593658 RepID=UPI0025AB25E6|nr:MULTISPECIES: anion transporter [unclassified Nostoc]MDM9582450.1 anion transporter [Nostoc sp. GT001]MDZ7944641.1 anion transporter [Nostoc sp. EfeVER01]MDZ7993688.1 anion transporter [Nostoc sp. EspVER01]